MTSTAYPFLFLRHGATSTPAQRLWVALADPAASTEGLRERLAAFGQRGRLRSAGPLLEYRVRRFTPGPEALEVTLLEAHRVTPLALVVRTTRVRGSPWHQHTLGRPGAMLDVFTRLLQAHQGPYRRVTARPFPAGLSLDRLFLADLRGDAPLAEALLATVDTWRASTVGGARAVLDDLLLERLPALTGRAFEVDLVVRHLLAAVQGLGVESVPMPGDFHDARAARMGEALAAVPASPGGVDWGSLGAVREALAQEAWVALGLGLREEEPTHVAVLRALTAAERATLARGSRGAAIRMANVAAGLLTRGDAVGALELYDAALEGDLDARVCANPLFAVQDDTHHLGVDVPRARRYLARCLPHGEDNPAIFLNAAFVFMELGEPSRALEQLGRAKAAGVRVAPYRNERLFAPLRTNAVFLSLMA